MIRARALSAIDINFIGTALLITAIGCLMIYSATYFNDPTGQKVIKDVGQKYLIITPP